MKRTSLKRGTSELKRTGFKPSTKPMQRGGWLKQKSPRQKEREARYKPIHDSYFAEHPFCERCGAPATEVHHKARKIGENMFRHLMSVCWLCHIWIHANVVAARLLGYLITDDPRREGE